MRCSFCLFIAVVAAAVVFVSTCLFACLFPKDFQREDPDKQL